MLAGVYPTYAGEQGSGGEEEEDEEEAEFAECGGGHTLPQGMLQRINQRGWTAYLIAVVQPQQDGV